MAKALTFIDLFCGCGGFSLGMQRAGFECLAAIDFNAEAIATFRANFKLPEDRVRREDLTQYNPGQLAELIGTKQVDVIVGGPPCQGFSTARQRDGANHGDRLKEDSRRHLYKEYLRYVEFFQPRIFIMENVLGIRTAAGGAYFTAVQYEARALGYRVHPQIENAYDLGVPQKRRRQLIIGVRNDIPGYFIPELKPAKRACIPTNLGAAISDLPVIPAGGGVEECDYNMSLRETALKKYGEAARSYLYEVLEVQKAKKLTAHRARPHSERDIGDFKKLKEGQSSADAMRAGVEFDFPYDKTTFKDRYTRQHRDKPCSTIVAHLSKDGLMFIHPWQHRSLTPREAARIQSFPDWFQFPLARTHQFRVIGNAVPPLISEAVGNAVNTFLKDAEKPTKLSKTSKLPRDLKEANERLLVLSGCSRQELRELDNETFIKGWYALLVTFPKLHPDGALDHGSDRYEAANTIQPKWRDRYSRSDWPVALVLIGEEAWRRHKVKELTEDELYCLELHKAAIHGRHLDHIKLRYDSVNPSSY